MYASINFSWLCGDNQLKGTRSRKRASRLGWYHWSSKGNTVALEVVPLPPTRNYIKVKGYLDGRF